MRAAESPWFATTGRRLAGSAALVLADTVRADVVGKEVRWYEAWEFEPAVVAGLFFVGALHACGLRLLRAARGTPRAHRIEARYFVAGWSAVALALVSPLHAMGGEIFAVHMTQHEVLLVIGAPLLVLGRPGRVLAWAIPRPILRHWVQMQKHPGVQRLLAPAARPSFAALSHAVALWSWHVPAWFEATQTSPLAHAAQHACFLGTAFWFWQSVLFGPRREAGFGLGVGYLFLTALHSGALGALLTLAERNWYPAYAATAKARGLIPLEDQQLGGLIMWVPGGLVYVAAALVLFARWLSRTGGIERRGGSPPAAGDSRVAVTAPR